MSLVKIFKAEPAFQKNTFILCAEILLLGWLSFFHSVSIPEEIRFRLDPVKEGHLQKLSLMRPYPLRFEIKYMTEGEVPANSQVSIRVNDHIQSFPEDSLIEAVGEKTVDIFPWEISLAHAYNMNWKPRPVMQSYVAYTPPSG
jgi:hypothetical protein